MALGHIAPGAIMTLTTSRIKCASPRREVPRAGTGPTKCGIEAKKSSKHQVLKQNKLVVIQKKVLITKSYIGHVP